MVIRRLPPSTRLPQGRCDDGRLPAIGALAALGPVLCLSRTRDTVLSGWRQAASCEYGVCVDSQGLRECLRFRAADGQCCWQLYALPDDDVLAWKRLIAGIPEGMPCGTSPGLAERMWRGLSDALKGRCWRASLIRIHAFLGRDGSVQPCLVMSQPELSPYALNVARRIAHAEGAEFALRDLDPRSSSGPRASANRSPRTPLHFHFPFTTGIPS